jgi:hypothetical protein
MSSSSTSTSSKRRKKPLDPPNGNNSGGHRTQIPVGKLLIDRLLLRNSTLERDFSSLFGVLTNPPGTPIRDRHPIISIFTD